MTRAGQILAARRGERGLTIEQVAEATRIRPEQLRALEADDLEEFAAPVYARGHLRAYASFLGLEREDLPDAVPDDRPSLGIAVAASPRPKAALTTPVAAAAGLVLLVGAFAGYAWRQISADQREIAAPAAPATGPATTGAAPAGSPAVQARPIVVGVRVTDTVWVNAVVDGKPQYGDTGRTLPAGSVVYFTGVDVKLTSGKASATFITVDGRSIGAMGSGVATREFSSQTSP